MRATRLGVANYKTTLSSDSLESGTGSSNSLRSAKHKPVEKATFFRDRRTHPPLDFISLAYGFRESGISRNEFVPPVCRLSAYTYRA